MIIKNTPAQTQEVTILQWGYDQDNGRLIIPYMIWGQQYAHTFTTAETDNRTNDQDMIMLLCQQNWFIINS